MKDFLGQELAIGDEVIFVERAYRGLKIGKVTGITSKRIHVVFPSKWQPNKMDSTTLDPQYNVVKKP